MKTDRKDAELLARLLLAGSLTTVVVPPVEVEGARELTRAHDACRRDLMTARHPGLEDAVASRPGLSRVLNVDDARYRRWLAAQQFDETVSELVFADLVGSVDGLSARAQGGDRRATLASCRRCEAWWPTVARLRCFPGRRHPHSVRASPRTRRRLAALRAGACAERAWLGLIPSLHQSGESSHQGSITKTGSGFARRLLVESAWHYGRPPRIGVTLKNRQQGQPDHVLQIANRAQHRLHRVYHRMRAAARRTT